MSSTESDDEDLARAIALSLQEGGSTTQNPVDIVDLTEDDDVIIVSSPKREEPRRLPTLSTQTRYDRVVPLSESRLESKEGKPKNTTTDDEVKVAITAASSSTKQATSNSSLLGLNRKQMEEERLARIKKRRASISPPLLHRSGNRQGQNGSNAELALIKRQATEASMSSRQAPSFSSPQGLNVPGIQYPHGTVKRTWAFGCPRVDDIKIEEVLQKNTLELAVLSAFQWDDEWILSKLDMKKTRLVCVVQAEDEQQKAEMRANAPSQIRFCFPSMAGQINCMHSKLQLLSHPTHLRVVVPSANLVPYDWGEAGGVMENSVFLIDLPRLPNGEQKAVNELTFFGTELLYFLERLGLEQKIIDSVRKFDFSATKGLAFVHSVGGAHDDESWKRTGYCGLGTAIRTLGLETRNPVTVDVTSASIGSLNMDFMRAIYLACQGDDGLTEYNWRLARQTRKKAQANVEICEETTATALVENNLRIYFPSQETVANSKGGSGAGGTICFQSRWWEGPQFPRQLMRDCLSQRPRMLMHNKMIFARPHNPPLQAADGSMYAAWAYVGSANLSESAWGKLVKDRTTKQPKLNCRNWECGVVVPVPMVPRGPTLTRPSDDHGESKGSDSGKSLSSLPEAPGPVDINVFQGFIPVPMRVPAEPLSNGRRPWFYSERM